MSTQHRAFRPLAATQNVAVTGTAQTVTLNYTLGTHQIRFCNIGTEPVFVLPSSASTQTAATVTNAIPITIGATVIFTLDSQTISFSVIAAGAGSTLYSTVGEGL